VQSVLHYDARDGCYKFSSSWQVASTLVIQSAVARQLSHNLPHSIRSEIEANSSIFVANRGYRLVTIVSTHKRHNELIGHAAVVRILHSLNWISVLASLALPENHAIESHGNALPAPVAIHRVVAAVEAGNLAAAVFAHLLLKLLQIAGATRRKRIAPIHKSMHKHALQPVLLSHLQKRGKMCLLRVHATVRHQSKQMQPPPTHTGMLHRREQHRMLEKIPILDHQ